MRNLIKVVLLTALSVPLFAQYGGWNRDGYGYGNNSGYGNGGYGRRSAGGAAVERALYDLQRIGSRGYMDRHEQGHVSRAIGELQEFRYQFQQGRFDNGRLDRAIDSMKHLANARQLDFRERELVARHIENLRAFRSSGGR